MIIDLLSMSDTKSSTTIKEKLHFNEEGVEQGDTQSLAVYSTIQNQGSKEWLLASDIPQRQVCFELYTF
jgi:hypothetical protein